MFSFTSADDGQLMLSITGGFGGASTVIESVSLPAELLTDSHTTCVPDASNVGLNVGLSPLRPLPPIHNHSSGSPPDNRAVQVTVSPALGRGGEQLMLSITGGSGLTVTAVDSRSLPAELRTVSQTVFAPAESKRVR